MLLLVIIYIMNVSCDALLLLLLLQVWSKVVSQWTSHAGRSQLLDVECGPLDR